MGRGIRRGIVRTVDRRRYVAVVRVGTVTSAGGLAVGVAMMVRQQMRRGRSDGRVWGAQTHHSVRRA